MDAQTVSQLIGSLGFPIVACGFMGWYCVKLQATLQDLQLTLKELTTKFDDHVDRIEG